MKTIKKLGICVSIIIALVLCMMHFSGCNTIENVTNSGSRLIVMDIVGTDLTGNQKSHTIFSDVATDEGSIANDPATVSLSAQLLDPLDSSATYYQDITVDQIDVEFSRSDGLNVQGKDVPYSFSQKCSVVVPIREIVALDFVLISHNAKLESPLVELLAPSKEILKLEAKITVHGKDGAGRRVQPAVGYISVWCSNFADPE
ncbi:MAG: hypothetical protein ACM3SY_08535 [Candidatus Omnitrophota bacterium]